MPDGWAWCRLQMLCIKEIKRGKAPRYVDLSNTLVFAQKCNTKAGSINISIAKFLDETILKKYDSEDFMQYNDIIINSTGTGTLGRVGIFKETDDINNLPVVPDTHITTIRASSNICAEYLYAYLKFHQNYFENAGEGSTNQKELRPETIKNFVIAIPPLLEQQKITKRIKLSNKQICLLDVKKTEIRATISAIKSKILDLAIRGKLVPQDPNDEPASILLERIRAEKEELIKQGKIKRDKKESVIFKGDDNSYYEKIGEKITCIDDEIPFEIPDNWCWARLSSFTEVIMGSSPRSQDICRDSNYTEFHQGKIYFSDCLLKESNQYTKKISKIAPKNSVLLCVRAPVGEVNITDREICIGRGLSSIHAYDKIQSNFLFYWLKTQKHVLVNKSTGSTFSAITVDTVKNILLPIPPITEQLRITQKILDLNSNIESIKASLR